MEVCLFDIDGTLLSSGGAGKAALEASLTEEFGTSLRVQVPYSGRTDRAIARDLFRLHDIDDTPAHWDRLLGGYLRRLPDSLMRHHGRVLPGILHLLDVLQGRGVPTGLLTGNVRAGARVKLGHFDLDHRFPFGGFGDHHLERDDVAHEALASVRQHVGSGVAREHIWVIGDTPLDVRCARAIGVRVVAVATGVHTVAELAAAEPDVVLSDLSDLAPLGATWGW